MRVLHKPQSLCLCALNLAAAPQQVQHEGAKARVVGVGSQDSQLELVDAVHVVPVAPGVDHVLPVYQLHVDLHIAVQLAYHLHAFSSLFLTLEASTE